MRKIISYFTKEEIGSKKMPKRTLNLPSRRETLKIEDLSIDPENYQRELKKSFCASIADNFDYEVVKPPLVGRRETGELAVVDGAHTVGAHVLFGITEITCDVIIKTTTEVEERKLFNIFNSLKRAQAKKLKLLNNFKDNDPKLVRMNNIVEACGFKVAIESKPVGSFDGIATLYKIYDFDDGKTLFHTLDHMAKAWAYDEEHRVLNIKTLTLTKFLTGIGDFFIKYGLEFRDGKKYKKLLKTCQNRSPLILLQMCKEQRENFATILIREYNNRTKKTDVNYVKEVRK